MIIEIKITTEIQIKNTNSKKNKATYIRNKMSGEKQEKKKQKSKKSSILGGLLIIAVGLIVMMYPTISEGWNQMKAKNTITQYTEEIKSIDDDTLDKAYEEAVEYNKGCTINTPYDAFGQESKANSEYDDVLNINGDGVMGYIEIPKIEQRLVIYHGTSEKVLQKGCGHLAGTSLPVGGKGNHAIIAGHRGLPTMKIFTDVDQLVEGDRFMLFILNKTLAYEVDQIKVVEPEDVEEMQQVEGKDYVTLVTCTPYGVNTHRLLIRGHRVKYNPEEDSAEDSIISTWQRKLLLAFMTFLIVVITSVMLDRRKNKKQHRREETGKNISTD